MTVEGVKHTIECHCILPQYKSKPNPPWHKFVVFSIIDDSNTVIPKYAQCNNCGVIHKVVDLCKSEIIPGKDELRSIKTIEDIAITIPSDIRSVLENYSVDIPTWEMAQFLLQEKQWGKNIILTKEIINDEVHGKAMFFDSADKVRIESFSYNTVAQEGS